MSNTLNMQWSSQSTSGYNFVALKVKHGDPPTSNPGSLLPKSGSSTTVAKQSTNVTPGPEGTYEWQSTDLTQTVECDYHFPAGGSGQLIQITLKPSNGLEVSFDGQNWSSGSLPMSANSTSDTYTQKCYLKDKTK